MKKTLVSAALAVSLLSVPAFAKRDDDKHKDRSDKHEWKDKDKDKERFREKRKEKRDRDDQDGNAQGERRKHEAANGRPPGWDKGKKTGWGNCDVPPGQAKKEGCRSDRRTRPARRSYPTRTYPPRRRTTTTTTTTTTTSTANPQNRSGHPFGPVLREKQKASTK